MKCPYCDGSGELKPEAVHFGTLLLIQRRAKGFTQEQLAEKVGRSRAQIANLESGRGDVPLKQVMRMAEALGISAKELVP
jgi:transcriptional regulator with XRE-family HTH domain